MRRALFHAVAAVLVIGGLSAVDAAAQAATQHDAMPATHEAPAAQPGAAAALRAAVGRQIGTAREELTALAEAMPAEKYTWRPADGVRSVGEVYMHVATANFFLPTFWSVQPPAGVDVRGLEKLGADKAKTVATLKQSFDHLQHAIETLPDADLGKPVNFFGRQMTMADLLLQATAHGHEHLGQAIAYARMNGVVPPWSAAQGQRGQ
jgi:uncharacterized damage-inducible protein DinB